MKAFPYIYTIYLRYLSMLMALCAIGNYTGYAAQTTSSCPSYFLTIDSLSLHQLNANPWSDIYVPAHITVQDKEYSCQVRYRGGSTRGVPKKSWRIKFENDDNPFHASHLNLTSQYIDPSFLRNFLVVQLYKFLDIPTPEVQYVQFFVNGVSHGLYLEVENVDEYFFVKRGIAVGEVFKGNSHGARFAPLVRQKDYAIAWEKKLGQAETYRTIQLLSSSLTYLPQEEFEQFVKRNINVPHVLQYFAIEYILAAHDNITKNFYLYFDINTQYYSILPWDNDASMGNDWQGIYHSNSYTLRYTESLFKVQLLFQRMMKTPLFRQQFIAYVHTIINSGFDHITPMIDSVADEIRPVVYNDTLKRDSNADFERSIGEIKDYLALRKDFLQGYNNYEYTHPSALACSHAFAEAGSTVTFQATAPPYTPIVVEIAHEVNFDKQGEKGEAEHLLLFDDGRHNDGQKNDGFYANTFTVPTQDSPIIPYVFSTSYGSYPESGLVNIENQPSIGPAIIVTSATVSDYRQLYKTNVYQLHNDIAVAFVNASSRSLDLSFSLLRSQSHELRFPFPPRTVLAPGDTLLVTSNPVLVRHNFPSCTIVGDVYFPIVSGDTLALIAPNNTTIALYPIETTLIVPVPEQQTIINEIQYAPADALASGEWVELWNPTNSTIDMAGWYIQDADDTHSFLFPASTTIPPYEYIVLCSDTTHFAQYYPDITQRIGNMDFRLGSEESIRLYDAAGRLIDLVSYTDHSPWPKKIEGSSLSLCNPSADNSLPNYWYTSSSIGGTPGTRNPDCPTPSNILPLVINEINYRSTSQFDAGDWVEIYNPTEQKADISHWILTDEKDDHSFAFASGTTILPYDYLIVYRKRERFTNTYPLLDTSYLSGPMEFGLKSEHGEVRLFNAYQQLVDSVSYSAEAPWPSLSDRGETIELQCPYLDNTMAEYWTASSLPGGTPASRNSITAHSCPHTPTMGTHVTVFPNPVADVLTLHIYTEQKGVVTADIFDIVGRHVATLYHAQTPVDTVEISWSTEPLRSGIYTVVVKSNNALLSSQNIIHFK